MARFEVQFCSKTKEVAGMPLLREFGGTEGATAPGYRFESAQFSARDEKRALAKGRKMAKSKNLILLTVIKTVWKKRNAVC